MQIQNALITGSFSYNGADLSNITSSNVYSASLSIRTTDLESTASVLVGASSSFSSILTSVSSSQQQISASLLTLTASYNALSSSYTALSASYNTASSSFSTRITSDSSSMSSRTTQVEKTYASTGSNTFTGLQNFSNTCTPNSFTAGASIYTAGGLQVTQDSYFSSSVFIKGNVTVFGTQSVSYISSSQLDIGTNIITVNTSTPSVRYGGLSVFDSGSTGLTGSIFWDSELNRWIYVNASGSGGGATYGGGMFISGPRNSVGLGCEQGTTACMLLVGQGGDHLTSSMIYHSSTVTCIPNTLIGSVACFSGQICGSGATFANTVNITNNTGGAGLSMTNTAAPNITGIGSPTRGMILNGLSTTAAATGASFYFYGATNSYTSLTSGDLLQVTNNDAVKFRLDYAGAATFSSTISAKTESEFTGTSVNTRILITASGVANTVIGFNNSGATTTGVINNAGYVGILQAYPLVFTTDGTERLRITSTGNVGIGTSNPLADLQVSRTGEVVIAMGNNGSITSGNRGTLAWYNSADSTVAIIRATAVTDNVGTQLEFYTRPAAGSLAQKMILNSSGRLLVGGGVTDNGASIQTNGDIRADYSSAIYLEINGGAAGDYRKGFSGVNQQTGVARGLHIFNYDPDSSQGIKFFGGTYAAKARFGGFDSGGNFFVNATDSAEGYKLYVNGTVGVTGAATFSSSVTANSHIYAINGAISFGGSGSAPSTDPAIYRIGGLNDLAFAIGSTERMRITAAGQIYFNRFITSSTDVINIEGGSSFSGRGILINMDAGNDALTIGGSGTQNAINVTNSSKKVIISNLGGSGTVTVQADNTGTLVKSSDSSLKQEHKDYKIQGLAEILQLQPRAYKWLKDIEIRKEEAVTEIGFFADEVNPIIPSAAPKGFDGLYGFNDRAVTAALVKGMQEQQCTICSQASMINVLKTCLGIA